PTSLVSLSTSPTSKLSSYDDDDDLSTSLLRLSYLFFHLHHHLRISRLSRKHSCDSFSAVPQIQHCSSQPKLHSSRVFPDKPVLIVTWAGSDPSLPSILLNSHLDSVPAEPSKWTHPPFSAVRDQDGRIFARGAQDYKCIAIQYLEAIRNLIRDGFLPVRTVHISYVPDEEIGGQDGAEKFVASKVFDELRVGFMLDEGQASVNDEFRVFYADRCPWKVIIKASGQPGHGSRLYDNGAMENLMKSVEVISRFRESQFDVVKAGKAANSAVISVNPVYLKAGICNEYATFGGRSRV
ncbi:ACY1, partial [Linum grandiflorum]